MLKLFETVIFPVFLFVAGIILFVFAYQFYNIIIRFKRGAVSIKAKVIEVEINDTAEWTRYYPTLQFTTPDNERKITKVSDEWNCVYKGDTIYVLYNPDFHSSVRQDLRFEEITKPGSLVLIGLGLIYWSFFRFIV